MINDNIVLFKKKNKLAVCCGDQSNHPIQRMHGPDTTTSGHDANFQMSVGEQNIIISKIDSTKEHCPLAIATMAYLKADIHFD